MIEREPFCSKRDLEKYRRDLLDEKCSAIEVEAREFRPNIGGDYHFVRTRFESRGCTSRRFTEWDGIRAPYPDPQGHGSGDGTPEFLRPVYRLCSHLEVMVFSGIILRWDGLYLARI